MKKSITLIVSFFIVLIATAQQTDYYVDDGYVVEGYDVTEYFNNKAIEGNSKYVGTYDGVKFKFYSQANLDRFRQAPAKYVPQYGGYCAYAMATTNKKADSDPETFEIRGGKLFLFYNSWGINNKKKWLAENPDALKQKADNNWKKLQFKK